MLEWFLPEEEREEGEGEEEDNTINSVQIFFICITIE